MQLQRGSLCRCELPSLKTRGPSWNNRKRVAYSRAHFGFSPLPPSEYTLSVRATASTLTHAMHKQCHIEWKIQYTELSGAVGWRRGPGRVIRSGKWRGVRKLDWIAIEDEQEIPVDYAEKKRKGWKKRYLDQHVGQDAMMIPHILEGKQDGGENNDCIRLKPKGVKANIESSR